MADNKDEAEILKPEASVNTRPNEDLSAYMSPEERAALVDTDDDTATLESVLKGLKPSADELPPESDATASDDAPGDADDSAADAGAEQAAATQAQGAIAQAAQSAQAETEPPPITAQPVENLDDQVAQLEAQRAKLREDQVAAEEKLREKLEMADIEPDEFKKQMAALRQDADRQVEELGDKRRDLMSQANQYQAEIKRQQDWYAAQWVRDSKAFVDQAKREGIDYNDPAKPLLGRALNDEISRLNKEHGDWTNKQILDAAHKAVVTQLGLKPTRQSGKPSPKTVDIPPNIGSMPSTAGIEAGIDHSKFALADRAQGAELEAIVASMTDEERDEYLRS